MTTALSTIDLSVPGLSLPDGLSFEQHQQIGDGIFQAARNIQWQLGDWINYGAANYGDKFTAAIDRFGIKPQTARLYASVAARYDLLNRFNNLTWTHHQVAIVIEDAQLRSIVLAQALNERWSVSRLRDEVKGLARPISATHSDVVQMPKLEDVIPLYRDLSGVHSACLQYPMGTIQEWEFLVEGIKDDGQLEAMLVTPTGMLVDGKRRLLACHVLGLNPVIRKLRDNQDPWDVAHSCNSLRKHLTQEEIDHALTEIAKLRVRIAMSERDGADHGTNE